MNNKFDLYIDVDYKHIHFYSNNGLTSTLRIDNTTHAVSEIKMRVACFNKEKCSWEQVFNIYIVRDQFSIPIIDELKKSDIEVNTIYAKSIGIAFPKLW